MVSLLLKMATAAREPDCIGTIRDVSACSALTEDIVAAQMLQQARIIAAVGGAYESWLPDLCYWMMRQ
jgi:hypothetical protein